MHAAPMGAGPRASGAHRQAQSANRRQAARRPGHGQPVTWSSRLHSVITAMPWQIAAMSRTMLL
jgi:hypothetical protein